MKVTGSYKKQVWLQFARGDLLKSCSEDIWDISKKTSFQSCNLNKTTP